MSRPSGEQPTVLVVQHQEDCPPAWIGTWLHEAGCVLDVRRPDAGNALPDDLDGHDALLVLGGSMGAHDAVPWLEPTRALLRDAAAREVPALGVCLGHQLAAVAFGGRAGRNPRGRQFGLLDVGWTGESADDDLVGTLEHGLSGVHWNDDVVLDLPEEAVVLARAEGGEVQVARFAPTVWGVQAHPEVDDRILSAWAHGEPELDPAAVRRVLDEVRSRRAALEEGWRPLATRLAALACR